MPGGQRAQRALCELFKVPKHQSTHTYVGTFLDSKTWPNCPFPEQQFQTIKKSTTTTNRRTKGRNAKQTWQKRTKNGASLKHLCRRRACASAGWRVLGCQSRPLFLARSVCNTHTPAKLRCQKESVLMRLRCNSEGDREERGETQRVG